MVTVEIVRAVEVLVFAAGLWLAVRELTRGSREFQLEALRLLAARDLKEKTGADIAEQEAGQKLAQQAEVFEAMKRAAELTTPAEPLPEPKIWGTNAAGERKAFDPKDFEIGI